MSSPEPARVPRWPWLGNRWVQTVLVVAVFALLAAVFALFSDRSDRKDASYWSGYSDAQRWVHEGGYQAREESITMYCRDRTAQQRGTPTYERGCVDGARNAMK